MSNSLRSVLHDLGDVPPPPDLAAAALSRARRDRRRVVTVLVAATAVLAAAAVTVPAVALHRGKPTGTADGATGPLLVAGYATADDPYGGRVPETATGGGVSYPPGGEPQIYKRSRSGYAAPAWRITLPSPDGRLLAVSTAGTTEGPNGAVARPGRVGILPADRVDDPTSVRWVPGLDTLGWIRWTPDSTRLFVWSNARASASSTSPRATSVQLVDVRTLEQTTVAFALTGTDLVDGLPVALPGGEGYVLAMFPSSPGGGGVARTILRYYDQGGTPTREVEFRGVGSLPNEVDQPFSRDGRLVALSSGDRTQILDITSRQTVSTVPGTFVRWYDDQHVVVSAGRAVRVVELRTGRVVTEKQVAPAGRKLTAVWLAPLAGSTPPGAIVL